MNCYLDIENALSAMGFKEEVECGEPYEISSKSEVFLRVAEHCRLYKKTLYDFAIDGTDWANDPLVISVKASGIEEEDKPQFWKVSVEHAGVVIARKKRVVCSGVEMISLVDDVVKQALDVFQKFATACGTFLMTKG